MRELLGIVVLAALVHLLIVEVLAINVIGNCATDKPNDQAICSCMKNNLRFGYEVEKALIAGKAVDLAEPFKMCTAQAGGKRS